MYLVLPRLLPHWSQFCIQCILYGMLHWTILHRIRCHGWFYMSFLQSRHIQLIHLPNSLSIMFYWNLCQPNQTHSLFHMPDLPITSHPLIPLCIRLHHRYYPMYLQCWLHWDFRPSNLYTMSIRNIQELTRQHPLPQLYCLPHSSHPHQSMSISLYIRHGNLPMQRWLRGIWDYLHTMPSRPISI